MKGCDLDQRRADLEKRPRSGLRSRKRPLLSFIGGFRVSDDLPGRRGAAHVGGATAGACQEAKAAASEEERDRLGLRQQIWDYS